MLYNIDQNMFQVNVDARTYTYIVELFYIYYINSY